jgi:hypothetical protein
LRAEGWGKEPAKRIDNEWTGYDEPQQAEDKAKSPAGATIEVGGHTWDAEPDQTAPVAESEDWATWAIERKPNDLGGWDDLPGAPTVSKSLTVEGEEKPKPDLMDEEKRLDRILDAARIDTLKKPPELIPILSLKNNDDKEIMVLSEGNIATVKAQAKSGKSHFMAALAARLIAGKGADIDSLGWVADNREGKAVIIFDFEQSKYHSWNLFKHHMCRRAKCEENPEWLQYYNLVGMGISELRPIVRRALKRANEAHGGIKLAILDGYADLLRSVNDEDESVNLVAEMMAHAQHYRTGIIGIIHENTGQNEGKARGHVGSQLIRKSEVVIQIAAEKRSEKNVAWLADTRNAPLPKTKAIRWAWDEQASMFATCRPDFGSNDDGERSEEHTSELQSPVLL